MRGAQDVRQEIANTLDTMRGADASERDYLVGRLAGLLWVADGETLPATINTLTTLVILRLIR